MNFFPANQNVQENRNDLIRTVPNLCYLYIPNKYLAALLYSATTTQILIIFLFRYIIL